MTTQTQTDRDDAADILRATHKILLDQGRSQDGAGGAVCGPVCIQQALSLAAYQLGFSPTIIDSETRAIENWEAADRAGPARIAFEAAERLTIKRLPIPDGGYLPMYAVNDYPERFGIDPDEADDFWFNILIDAETELRNPVGGKR